MRLCRPSPSSQGPQRQGLGVSRLPSLLPWPCSAPRPTAANTEVLSEDAPGVRATHPWCGRLSPPHPLPAPEGKAKGDCVLPDGEPTS